MSGSRRPRRPEPRITDLATHPQAWVNLRVAADFLEMDYRSVVAYLEEQHLQAAWKGRRRRIHLAELARFKAWLAQRAIAS